MSSDLSITAGRLSFTARFEGRERLAELVLWHGAQDIVFELV